MAAEARTCMYSGERRKLMGVFVLCVLYIQIYTDISVPNQLVERQRRFLTLVGKAYTM